jgi:hypothetical protein
MTPGAPPKAGAANGRWFSHRLFGLCGEGGVCPPAANAPAAAEPAKPRWRGGVPAGMKAA